MRSQFDPERTSGRMDFWAAHTLGIQDGITFSMAVFLFAVIPAWMVAEAGGTRLIPLRQIPIQNFRAGHEDHAGFGR